MAWSDAVRIALLLAVVSQFQKKRHALGSLLALAFLRWITEKKSKLGTGLKPSDLPPLERPLRGSEDIFWRFDSVSPVYFGSIARMKGVLKVEDLTVALDELQKRHPLLRVCIQADENGVPWFRETCNKISLNVLMKARGDEWSILERELTEPFHTEQGPLLRIILVKHDARDSSLISIYHHAISDGMSAIYITRDILKYLAQISSGNSPRLPLHEPHGYFLDRLPSMEKLVQENGVNTIWETIKASAEFVEGIGLPVSFKEYYDINADLPLSEQKLIIEPRILKPEFVNEIVKQARKQKTSVQCVLNAALACAASAEFHPRFWQAIYCSQVLDVRHKLSPPAAEECGYFCTGISSLHHISENRANILNPGEDFWELARDIHTQMVDKFPTPLPYFHPELHEVFAQLGRFMGNSKMKEFSEFVGSLHPEALVVSNLGRKNIVVDESPVQVVDLALATNCNLLQSLNTTVITYAGQMNWSFSGTSALGRSTIARIADRSIVIIENALKGQDLSTSNALLMSSAQASPQSPKKSML